MDIWLIYNKLVILIFCIYSYVNYGIKHESEFILYSLIYIILNILIYLVDKNKKVILSIASSLLLVYFYLNVSENLILLLPMNIYEFIYFKYEKKKIGLLLSIIPILFIGKKLSVIYLLVTFLSYIIFDLALKYFEKINVLEKELDEKRKEKQRLIKELNEKREYIRQSEYTIKLEERNKLSQEIHDSIGHTMTGSLIQMEASKSLVDIDKERSKELLQNAINISKKGIEEIRQYLKYIKPQKETLNINRLKLLAEEFTTNNNIRVVVTHRGDMEVIDYIHWRMIYENIIEAMTNTAKYSNATKVNIDIEVLNKLIRVIVKDDGKGGKVNKKGLGIIGMEERLSNVNGNLLINGENGFSVTMLIPIK